ARRVGPRCSSANTLPSPPPGSSRTPPNGPLLLRRPPPPIRHDTLLKLSHPRLAMTGSRRRWGELWLHSCGVGPPSARAVGQGVDLKSVVTADDAPLRRRITPFVDRRHGWG